MVSKYGWISLYIHIYMHWHASVFFFTFWNIQKKESNHFCLCDIWVKAFPVNELVKILIQTLDWFIHLYLHFSCGDNASYFLDGFTNFIIHASFSSPFLKMLWWTTIRLGVIGLPLVCLLIMWGIFIEYVMQFLLFIWMQKFDFAGLLM